MFRVVAIVVTVVAVTALITVTPALAQGDGGLASIVHWAIADGSTDEFEAGLKAHNQFHADQGDPVPILTWQVISGPQQGQYGRGSFNHKWADFDQDPELAKADTADSAATITPHIAGADAKIWQAIPKLSNPPAGPGAITRVIEFRLHPSGAQAFEAAVAKIHAALSKQEGWPAYEWYALVDGGYTPTWAVVLQRDNWAGFAPGEVGFMEAVAAEHGEMAGEIMQSLNEAIKSQLNYTLAFRPDLSYLPATDE